MSTASKACARQAGIAIRPITAVSFSDSVAPAPIPCPRRHLRRLQRRRQRHRRKPNPRRRNRRPQHRRNPSRQRAKRRLPSTGRRRAKPHRCIKTASRSKHTASYFLPHAFPNPSAAARVKSSGVVILKFNRLPSITVTAAPAASATAASSVTSAPVWRIRRWALKISPKRKA
jgi:hypothetical protein